MIPIVIFCYYIFVEAWCLQFAVEFFSGGFRRLFAEATAPLAGAAPAVVVDAVVSKADDHFSTLCGLNEHGAVFGHSTLLLSVAICFAANFYLIARGVARGIEKFCRIAMPALILCALVILLRVLTLPGIESGLAFMWNPNWEALKDPDVWVAAAGQVFFSLSVGFGLVLTYASYVSQNEDVVLSGLTAAGMNEFCEVVLGGMIVVPAAFLFLGASHATGGTFGLGFVTLPSIMYFMPGGHWFGGLWFGLLWLAAVTSSISMLQPAIAFLEQGYAMNRRRSVLALSTVCVVGTVPIMWLSKGALALDTANFWVGTFLIYVAATGQVLLFSWVLGAERGAEEANRGSDLRVPRVFPFVIRYVTPAFLLLVFGAWLVKSAPDYLRQMTPARNGPYAARQVYRAAAVAHAAEKAGDPAIAASLTAALDDLLPDYRFHLDDVRWFGRLEERLGAETRALGLEPEMGGWRSAQVEGAAAEARQKAKDDARLARTVFLAIFGFCFVVIWLSLRAGQRGLGGHGGSIWVHAGKGDATT